MSEYVNTYMYMNLYMYMNPYMYALYSLKLSNAKNIIVKA